MCTFFRRACTENVAGVVTRDVMYPLVRLLLSTRAYLASFLLYLGLVNQPRLRMGSFLMPYRHRLS